MVRNPAQYGTWLSRKTLGARGKRPTEMEIGIPYVFRYSPEPKNRGRFVSEESRAPLFIVTDWRNGGLFGINILLLPDRIVRERVIELVQRALEMDERKKAAELFRIRRGLMTNAKTKSSVMFYRASRIRGRIVDVEPEELDNLIKRVI